MSLLITLLILCLPLGVITRISLYPNVYIYLNDLIVIIIIIYFVIQLFLKKEKLNHRNVAYPILGFFVTGLISLLINYSNLNFQTFAVSFLYLCRYMVYISLIFVVMHQKLSLFKGLNFKLISVGVVVAIIGFIQYYLYPSLANLFYAGWDNHLYRLFSTFLDPNYAGIFLALSFILCVSNLIVSIEKKNKKMFIVYSLISALTLSAMYLTYSRSALISASIGIITLFVIKNKVRLLIPVFAVLVVVFFMFSNYTIEGLNPLRIASSVARIDSAKEALYIFEKNPILGVGFNSYRYAQVRYGFRKNQTKFPSNADAGTDNSYLFILATTGIVGFAFYSKFLYEIIKIISVNNKSGSAFEVAALPSFLALLSNALFINSLFYPLVIVWVFILVGVRASRKQ